MECVYVYGLLLRRSNSKTIFEKKKSFEIFGRAHTYMHMYRPQNTLPVSQYIPVDC